MIAALMTLVFLFVLGLSGAVTWQMLSESGDRIAKAVEGLPAIRLAPPSAAA